MFLSDVIMWPTYLGLGAIVVVIIAVVCLVAFLITLSIRRRRANVSENKDAFESVDAFVEAEQSDGAEFVGSDKTDVEEVKKD